MRVANCGDTGGVGGQGWPAVRILPLAFRVVLPVIVTWFLASIWFGVYFEMTDKFPPIVSLTELTVRVGGQYPERAIIGRDHLLQNPGAGSAEHQHLLVRQQADSKIVISNLANQRRLGLNYSNFDYLTSDMRPVHAGDVFVINDQRIAIRAVERRAIHYVIGAAPEKVASVYDACGIGFFLKNFLDQISKQNHRRCMIMRMGGKVDSGVFVSIDGAPEDSAQLIYFNDLFFLQTGRNYFIEYCPGGANCTNAGQVEWPLEHPVFGNLEQITIGRTGYDLSISGNSLKLKTVSRPHWVDERVQIARQVQVAWLSQNNSNLRKAVTETKTMSGKGMAQAFSLLKPPGFSIFGLSLAFFSLWASKCALKSGNRWFSIEGWSRKQAAQSAVVTIAIYLSLMAYPVSSIGSDFIRGNIASMVLIFILLLCGIDFLLKLVIFVLKIVFILIVWLAFNATPLPRLIGKNRLADSIHSMVRFDVTSWRGIAKFSRRKVVELLCLIAAVILFIWLSDQYDAGLPSVDVLLPEFHGAIATVILIHVLAGTVLFVGSPKRMVTTFIWFCYFLLVMFGQLNAIQLTFGGKLALYTELFQKQNFSYALVALAIILASAATPKNIRKFVGDYLAGRRSESRLFYSSIAFVTVFALIVWAIVGGGDRRVWCAAIGVWQIIDHCPVCNGSCGVTTVGTNWRWVVWYLDNHLAGYYISNSFSGIHFAQFTSLGFVTHLD